MEISIAGLDKAAVLAALYNASQPLGRGWLHYEPGDMSVTEAAEILRQATKFEYLKGRVMKVDLKGDSFDPTWYDRDNGQGKAAGIITTLQRAGSIA